MKVRNDDLDTVVNATFVRHLRTLTDSFGRGDNDDLDLYRLDDGREVVCRSPANDCRVLPCIVEFDAARAMFIE